MLAKTLSVDQATISRDIQYLRNWREQLIETKRTTFRSRGIAKIFGGDDRRSLEMFADLVFRRLVEAHIHPRLGFSYIIRIRQGLAWMDVTDGRR